MTKKFLPIIIIRQTYKSECLQGRVKFPIGGIVRERSCAGASARDLVQFQNRQYSLDERRRVSSLRLKDISGLLLFLESNPLFCLLPDERTPRRQPLLGV